MNKKGFTLIELLAVIVILSIILVITTPVVIKTIEGAKEGAFKNAVNGIVRSAEIEYSQQKLKGSIDGELIYTFANNEQSSNVEGHKLKFKGTPPKNGQVIVNKIGEVALALHNGKYCIEKKHNETELEISEKELKDCSITVTQPYVDNSGANKPELATGMTPIIWNGTDWIEASNIDDPYKQDWYDYDNQKWANAKTVDGSFWVWIPRYAYQIASGYHTSTAGTINIKFLQDKTNITSDGTPIATTPAYSGSSQTNYVKHPAFNFGGEITGFWVAKFEPSGTSININTVPNVPSLRDMTIGDQFDAALAMKNNSKYGWNPSQVDTHMMKNDEWGAVAYLSKSIYGANTEVWINNSSTYTTGCAGSSVSASSYSGCENKYHTATGQKASTTHNIYGVYDMSGGATEHVSAYVKNNHDNITLFGDNLVKSDEKYKNIYLPGNPDTAPNNYITNLNAFGDAVYETSSSAEGEVSWYGDFAYMPTLSVMLFHRGGTYAAASNAGLFRFHRNSGGASNSFTFRPVVAFP